MSSCGTADTLNPPQALLQVVTGWIRGSNMPSSNVINFDPSGRSVGVQSWTTVVFDVELVHVTAVVGSAFSKILQDFSHPSVRNDGPDTRYVVTRMTVVDRRRPFVVRGTLPSRRRHENRVQRHANVAALEHVTGRRRPMRRRRRHVQRHAAFHHPSASAGIVVVIWNLFFFFKFSQRDERENIPDSSVLKKRLENIQKLYYSQSIIVL